jgi:phosphate-selective porin OprO/OprP
MVLGAVTVLCTPILAQQDNAPKESTQQGSTKQGTVQQESTQQESTQQGNLQPNNAQAQDESVGTLPQPDETNADDESFKVFWKDGLYVESSDIDLKLKFGGRIQMDGTLYDARNGIEELGDFDDDFEVRRGRVYYKGTWGDHFEFKTQIEFSENNVEARDVYIGFRNIPIIGSIRMGYLKEPIGLELQASSNNITFMERPTTADGFQEGRNTGILAFNTAFDERMTWAFGFFRNTGQFFAGEITDGLAMTGRLTGLPWYEEDGAKLLHLGIAWRHFDPHGDPVRLRARPESHVSPRLVDSATIAADMEDILGVELAWVHGPFALQGEYFHSWINRQEGLDTLEFNTCYIEASYFLTGEHRNYKKSSAAFVKIKPKKNFLEDGGLGAWQVAGRYSYVDLNDSDINGGRLSTVAAALNWYPNSFTRVMFNYIYADPDDSGQLQTYEMRVQFAF